METTTTTVDKVLDVFQNFRMPSLPTDQYDTVGKDVLRKKMLPFIENNEPIAFSMLGYPMKSPNNRDKVLGTLPDYAEKVSLTNFARLNHEIRKVYTRGARITLISDGYMFSDILDVPDSTVTEYVDMNKDYSSLMPIEWYDAADFYSKKKSLREVREKITAQFGITPEELERRIMMDPDVHSLYLGMIKFMNLDIAIRDFPSKSKLQQAAKKLAREMMFRNEAYSALIRSEFPNHIRLSMHQSINNGTKFSFQLIPSPKAWTSPWHCALAINKDGILETIHKRDAIARGMDIVTVDGKPSHFVEI